MYAESTAPQRDPHNTKEIKISQTGTLFFYKLTKIASKNVFLLRYVARTLVQLEFHTLTALAEPQGG